jgi:PadR family transcriptional regulator, regulatory protein PadR
VTTASGGTPPLREMTSIRRDSPGPHSFRNEAVEPHSIDYGIDLVISILDIAYRYRASMSERSLYTGLIRLHILHHAVEEPIFGQAMIDELSRHGYRLSAGTLYPILHGMERLGYLRSQVSLSGGRNRRIYRATGAGRKALLEARTRVKELFGEMFEHD